MFEMFECGLCSVAPSREPVLTGCGHLFCWACMYEWLAEFEKPPAEKPSMEVVSQRPGDKRHLVNPIYRRIQIDDHRQVIGRRTAYRWVVAKPGGQPVGGQAFSSEPADHVPYWKSSESSQGGQPQLYQHFGQLGAI